MHVHVIFYGFKFSIETRKDKQDVVAFDTYLKHQILAFWFVLRSLIINHKHCACIREDDLSHPDRTVVIIIWHPIHVFIFQHTAFVVIIIHQHPHTPLQLQTRNHNYVIMEKVVAKHIGSGLLEAI